MYLCELCIYELLEEDEPEQVQMVMRDSKDRCLNFMHKIKGSLKKNEYFEIYCDETLETNYFLNNGTEVRTFQELIQLLNA